MFVTLSEIDYYKDWHKALVIGVVQNVFLFRRYRHSSLQGSCLHFQSLTNGVQSQNGVSIKS